MRTALVALALSIAASTTPAAAQGFNTLYVVPVVPHASGIREASPAPWYNGPVRYKRVYVPNAKVIELAEPVGPTPCGVAFEVLNTDAAGCVEQTGSIR